MQAGWLRERITLLSHSLVDGLLGEKLEGFAEAGKRWAAVLELRATESEREGVRQAQAEFKFVVHPDSLTRTIEPTWRVGWKGRTYEVTGVDDSRPDRVLVFVKGAA